MPLTSLCLLFLGSFGIYIGRYLRWNSWDIIREPFAIYFDISDTAHQSLSSCKNLGNDGVYVHFPEHDLFFIQIY